MKTHSILLGLLVASHAFAAEDAVTNRASIPTDHLSFYTNYVSIYTNYVSIYTNDITILANRLTLSARFGFNIHAKFGPRLTPDGLAYNYLDGYVRRDSTGDFDPTGTFPGITQNWGYDHSTRQNNPAAVPYPTISMTRLASGADPVTDELNDDASPGFELVYARQLFVRNQWHFGVEAAVNFTSIGMSESGTTSGSGFQDAYQYFIGTSPPNSPNANGEPYQGRFDQAGFVISETAAGSTPVPVSVAAQRRFDADLWGFRVDPYVEGHLGSRW